MQASHVPTPSGQSRCPKCWLLNAQPGHFCRWNVAQEGARDPNPPMRFVPIYRWVKDG